jgi:hypothetical protein
MKRDRYYWLTICTIILVLFNIANAFYKAYPAVSEKDSLDILAMPVLSLLVYFLLSYFIKHPKLLVKKSPADYENPERSDNANAITRWKNIYYYFRLLMLIFITIVSFL